MLIKNRTSLIKQTRLLFTISITFIALLWIGVYAWQKNQEREHSIARYFSIASSLQPYLMESYEFSDEDLKNLNVRNFKETIEHIDNILYQKGDDKKGFQLFLHKNKKILYVYNPINKIYLEDLEKDYTLLLIHSIFIVLLLLQTILYLISTKMLRPLLEVESQFTKLESGDFSELKIDSNYKEIAQITTSYNSAIHHIEYLLETREMFNKIFMHEIKTPLAKGMFYLKNEPSEQTHEQIKKIFTTINNQLDSFRTLEELIAKNEKNSNQKSYLFCSLLEELKPLLHVKYIDNIELKNCNEFIIYGDKELWLICFKNIIENALNYSSDNKVEIECRENSLFFTNKGDPLPIDISDNLKSWEIEKSQRYKSSTGYGFGLFIIQKSIFLNNYSLNYSYKNNNIIIQIKKKGD